MADPRSNYRLQNKLGKGAFATVYLASSREGHTVAVKRVRLDSPNADIESCRREVLALTRISSPYITAIYGAYVTGRQLWIVLEHMGGGSIEDIIKSTGPLHDDAIARILYCSVVGLGYMHARQLVHRDIKPDNILLTLAGDAKLCDLGVSYDAVEGNKPTRDATVVGPVSADDPQTWLPKVASRTTTGEEISMQNFVGTPYYMAPEVISQTENSGKSDIWSLGITVIEMVTGKCPRADFHPMKAMLLTKQDPPPTLDRHPNAKLVDFLGQCLLKDPAKRSAARDLVSHKFVKSKKKKVPKQLLMAIAKHREITQDAYSSGSEDEDEDEFNCMGIDHGTEPWQFL